MPFEKTPKQVEAIDVLNAHRHAMLFGGSRSGKSVIIARHVFLRAMKRASRHLIVRYRFNHAKQSLAHDTIPWILSNCFPGVPVLHNQADNFWTVPSADGGKSEVWLGGTDDKQRVEKILGTQYSTIWVNEASQVPFEAILMLRTRLAERSGLKQRMYYDENPPGRKHWTNLFFNEGQYPSGEKHDMDVGCLQMNPGDNAFLPPEYLAELQSLPKRLRQRFLEGLFLADVEGALWTDAVLVRAKLLEYGEPRRTVVAVDPSVSFKPGSDECGIVVASTDDGSKSAGAPRAVIRADLSGKMPTRKWAERAVFAHHQFNAHLIVAEKNQGGDLIADAIHAVDPYVKVELIAATEGKAARAEPASMLYERDEVAHAKDMPELEAEMTETAFNEELKRSPNRLDAAVLALTYLKLGKTRRRFHVSGS